MKNNLSIEVRASRGRKMPKPKSRLWWHVVVASCAVLSSFTLDCAARDAFSTYGNSYRAVTLPPIGGGSFGIVGDALADGRLVTATGTTVYLERGVGLGVFDAVAMLDTAYVGGAIDPAFLRVSPDGASIAIGGGFNKPVAVFAAASLGVPGSPTFLAGGMGGSARYYQMPHYEGAWADSSHLALTAGDFGLPAFVSLLDVASTVTAPVNPTIIRNIGGASTGVAFDAAGRLYTGNGFDNDPSVGSNTGTIRAFTHAEWAGGNVDFETQGTLIGRVLSAASLVFDADGNLFVGGGDFGSDAGYLGVINHIALADAFAGFGPINGANPSEMRRLDPLGNGFGYFGSAYNRSTGELSITSGTTWYVTVPGPGSAGVILVSSLIGLGRRARRGGKEVSRE